MEKYTRNPSNFGQSRFVSNGTEAGEAEANAGSESIAAAVSGCTLQSTAKFQALGVVARITTHHTNTPSIQGNNSKPQVWGPK